MGLDLEVISYEPVLSRRRCNGSAASTFGCSPPVFQVGGREAQLFQTTTTKKKKPHTLGWDLTRMESNPGPSAHVRDHWEKFRPDADTNI